MRFRTGHLKEEREGKEIKEQPILGSISFLSLSRALIQELSYEKEKEMKENSTLESFNKHLLD